MASPSSLVPLLVFLFSFALLQIQSNAANCSSQSFSSNRAFALCSDLPHLNASIHWTYNASNSSISIAFVSPPANSDGWIAWAINPTAKGMVGSQALLAFRGSNGSMSVHTYNITAYGPISPSAIDFAVWSAEAEHSAGVMRIFASLALPNNATTVNQVWQVGAAVTGTSPAKHAFSPENLSAKGTLDLTKGGSSDAGASSPAPGGAASAVAPGGADSAPGGAAPAPGGGGAGAAGPSSGGGSNSSVSSLFSHSLPFSYSVAVGIAAFSLAFSY